jgi:hypothetical protein
MGTSSPSPLAFGGTIALSLLYNTTFSLFVKSKRKSTLLFSLQWLPNKFSWCASFTSFLQQHNHAATSRATPCVLQRPVIMSRVCSHCSRASQVLTNHASHEGKPTGWFLAECAHPYHQFVNAG